MGCVHHPGIWGRGIAPLQLPSYQRPSRSRSLIPDGVPVISRERLAASWCTQLSWAPTPMPHPTPVRTSGLSLGSRLPTLHCPSHASQVSHVHNAGLKRHAVGGVLLNAPSPLWGSPIFLQGSIRLTWSPMHS